MELVTVILLTYNHEKTIAKAFDSILEQKTNFDFCIHVLEDCSTDATATVCKEYQAKFPEKIKLFLNTVNLGVLKNYKSGLQRVTSRYIAFLEGDDYWCDPQKLQMQVDALEAHPECTMCGHNVLFKDHVKNIEYRFIEDEMDSQKHIYSLEDRLFIHPSARLYRNIVDWKDIPDALALDIHTYTVYLAQGKLYYIDRVMSVYNKTGEGYWSGMKARNKRLAALKWQYEANQYFDFAYEAGLYKTSSLLKIVKKMFGVKRGWQAFYYLESMRLYIKYFFKK